MSFSTSIIDARKRIEEYRHQTVASSNTLIESILNPSTAQLLWDNSFGKGGSLDALIIEGSKSAKCSRYGGTLFSIVPVYVTSHCSEQCLYCNYRADNQGINLKRIRLSAEELDREVNFLAREKGLLVVELVYATDPVIRVDRMCQDIERTRKLLEHHGGGTVGINAEALDEEEYRRLKNAGLNFAVLWQETYDETRYASCHPGTTKKTCFEYRIESYERMLAAGIDAIGMGVLSGLADWRADWALLMEHEAYLFQTFGITPAILGVPRLKKAAGALIQHTSTIPSRQELKCLVALHNNFSPSTTPFLNTREDWELCCEMAAGGGALFTFNCSTIPGGYAAGNLGYQFPTGDYDAPLFTPRLASQYLHPVFDWKFVHGKPLVSGKHAFVSTGI